MGRVVLILILVLSLGASPLAYADADAPPSAPPPAPPPVPSIRQLEARLGSPVLPDALEEVRADLDLARADVAERLAGALGRAGGAEAAAELAELVRHPSRQVRLVAWEAAARTGLRHEPLARAARTALESSAQEAERAAAATLLGWIGDGRDVPKLLDRLRAAMATSLESRAICQALARLGGTAYHESPERWRAWWETIAIRDRPEVVRSLDAMADPKCAQRELYRVFVHRYGWIDLVAVRGVAEAWLAQPDPTLRAEACRLVQAFGLADLGPAVISARCFDLQSAYTADAEAALRRLGFPSEPSEEPPGRAESVLTRR